MKRAICLCLLLALALGTTTIAEGGADYWTTWLDEHYHASADCADCRSGAVRVAAATAEAYGQTPCPKCVGLRLADMAAAPEPALRLADGATSESAPRLTDAAASEPAVWLPDVTAVPDLTGDGQPLFGNDGTTEAEDFSAFEDADWWAGSDIPLRKIEGGYQQMRYPVLAGEWMYYLRVTYDDEDDGFGFGPDARERALCRCRARDLSGEEVLLPDAEVPVNLCGIRDAGDGLILWYSEYSPYVTDVRFAKLDYAGGALKPFAEVQLKGMIDVHDAVIAGRSLYFSWDDSILDLSHEGATGKFTYIVGEIWRLSLDDGATERLFTEDRMIYFLTWAYGDLWFMDHDDNGWYYCALDPREGRRRELRLADNGSFMILNHRFYCWDADKKRTVSMNLDGSRVKTVSKERFDFRQAWRGHVLASILVNGKNEDHSTYAWYPKKSDDPSFEPDSAKKLRITSDDFMLGRYFYEHRDGAVSRVFDKESGDIAVVGEP